MRTASISWILALVLVMTGCSGADGDGGENGAEGPQGPVGVRGADGVDGTPCWAGLDDLNGDGEVNAVDCRGLDGADGVACWDLNGNGAVDVDSEDIDGDGAVDVADCFGVDGFDGSDGIACWDLDGNGAGEVATEDRNGDGTVDVLDCRGEDGHNTPIELTQAEINAIRGRAGVSECLGCHDGMNPNMVDDFIHSGMAAWGNVACADCHADNPAIPGFSEGHRSLPTANTCGTCHPDEYEGHRNNRHSIASIRNYECGRFDDFPRVFANGAGYHFNDEDVAQLQALMDPNIGAGADVNPTAVEKCMQCHNIENRCDSCHTRHRFSPQEARHPMACGTCHLGPDHPQIEMYETSKHGAMFESEGDTNRVPVCVDCHMPYNGKIFPKKTNASGAEFVSHDLSATIAYGPVGGGGTRAGFVHENDRVKFVSKEGTGVADYDELWYDWEDRKVYTDSTGATVAYDDIYDMSIQDADGNGRHDYKVVQVPDSPEKLQESRALMLAVCTKCHAQNFADERLLIADLIHENAAKVHMEAYDIVTALAVADIGPYSSDLDRPLNPDNGSNVLAANMKIRNLTDIEREYFNVMKYDQVKTWKGAYHFNPDYTHWLGWTQLNMTLGAIGDMATQQVLMDLWVRGLSFPDANGDGEGDIWSDGLYQGTLYVNGIEETVQLENYFDRFPGAGDSYLDWFDGAGLFNPAGDATADNEQDIDIDMDGTMDLVKDDGAGGVLPAGQYRAIATDKVVTFH